VSLRVTAGGATEVANKRVILRPAAEAIPEDQQGRPFRTPRLCEDVAEAGRLCAANANPAPPRLETPNGEWPGRGPITVAPGDKVKLRPLEPEAGDRQAYVALHNCWEVIDDPGLLETGGEYEREETRFWAWYADAGSLLPTDTALGDEPATRDAAWEAPREPGSYTLWVVERDGRGGVAWQDWELRVAEDAGQ